MEAIELDVYVDKMTDRIRVHGLGDIHKGAAHCADDVFREAVAGIAAHPNTYWIGLGDYIDCITYRDFRFDPTDFKGSDMKVEELADLPMRQVDSFLEDIKAISNKDGKMRCFGLIEGNHEWQSPKWNSLDVVNYIAGGVGAPLLGPSAFIRIRVRAKKGNGSRTGPLYTVTFFCHHGFGSGRMAGGDALQLQRMIQAAQADVFMLGHRHKQLVLPEVALYLDNRKPPQIRYAPRVGVMTGTFQRTMARGASSWGEKKGFTPAVLGSPYVEFWAETRRAENTKTDSHIIVRKFQASHAPIGDDPL